MYLWEYAIHSLVTLIQMFIVTVFREFTDSSIYCHLPTILPCLQYEVRHKMKKTNTRDNSEELIYQCSKKEGMK